MKCSLATATCAMLALLTLAATESTRGRSLPEREMWLTFGGFQFPNDKLCDLKYECFGDPTNGCEMAGDENGEAWCESEVNGDPRFDHEVVTGQNNMNQCVGDYTGWFCLEDPTTYRCMMLLRCEWNHALDTCEQMAYPAGYINGSEVRVPATCTDVETGMF